MSVSAGSDRNMKLTSKKFTVQLKDSTARTQTHYPLAENDRGIFSALIEGQEILSRLTSFLRNASALLD